MWKEKIGKSQMIALVAVFAALNVATDSLASLPEFPSGVWYSWNFLTVPLTAIVLGPLLGSAATFIGVMVGHYVYFIDAYEFLFTVGAPIGAAASALLFAGKWKPVLVYYTALFTAFLATPVAWQLPPWGMWDTYLAFALLVASVLLIRKGLWKPEPRVLPLVLVLSAFVGLEADVLFRVFLFVPCRTYSLFYGFDTATLQVIWSGAALITPIKAILSTVITALVGYPLIKTMRKTGVKLLQ
jgi:hypothetical protein